MVASVDHLHVQSVCLLAIRICDLLERLRQSCQNSIMPWAREALDVLKDEAWWLLCHNVLHHFKADLPASVLTALAQALRAEWLAREAGAEMSTCGSSPCWHPMTDFNTVASRCRC